MKTAGRFGLLCLSAVLSLTAWAAPSLKISGAGWIESERIERSVRSLSQLETRETLDANAVEDAVFFTLSQMAAEGYLQARVRAIIDLTTGETLTQEFDRSFNELLPRPLEARGLRLEVERGLRFHFRDITFEGGEGVFTTEVASELMVPRSGLLRLRSERVFTPGRLLSGLEQLEVNLRARGYAQASAEAVEEQRDGATGAVDVTVRITPGTRWFVEDLSLSAAPPEVELPDVDVAPDQWWTIGWQQDVIEAVRQAYYEKGYTDVGIDVARTSHPRADGASGLVIEIVSDPGAQVIAGEPQFTGDDVVAHSILNRRVLVTAGEPLNPMEVETTRRRLGNLRAFSRVRVRYQTGPEGERIPVFVLEEREPWESSLLFGYGSYEQFRGGLEVRGFNLLSRSHQLRLLAVGSVKSQRGDLDYAVPDIFGETVDGRLRVFGLDRKELSFRRQEYGASLLFTRREVPLIDADFTVAYTYQDLRSVEWATGDSGNVSSRTNSASLTLGLNHDQRDNPLMPRQGVRWFGQVEVADSALGGNSGFQRVELGWTWHRPIYDTTWLHLGLQQGTVFTLGQDSDADLPNNKRFFPGGEHSLRGMRNGGAAPRNERGEFVGAKSVTLLNLEIEQALTRRITAVVFYDALGETARLGDGLWDVQLHTVGVGLRYHAIIGPVRLEYGHNLNPRPLDPKGTLHFSIGFPF